MTTIKLKDGRVVSKSRYVEVKTDALVEFGYRSLTKEIVFEQLEKVLIGDTDLTVIGLFIADDIDTSETVKA